MILQPQSIEPDAEMVSSVTVTHAELDEFTTTYPRRLRGGAHLTPRLERGACCRFCPAKPICPEHTEPLLDLAQLTIPTRLRKPLEAYLQVLAHILTLVDAVKDIGKARMIRPRQPCTPATVVPGYALTAGRAERHWRDDEPTAIAALRASASVAMTSSPRRCARRNKSKSAPKRAASRFPQEFIVSTRSGVSLTRVENARAPVPGRDEIVRSFSAALNAFQKGSNHDD